MAPDNRDIFIVLKHGTGSLALEVHVLTAASNYRAWGLRISTNMGEIGHEADVSIAPNRDLVIARKFSTGSGMVELYILAAATAYQSYVLQAATALVAVDISWTFLMSIPNRDLIGIKRGSTGTRSTEVHLISAASGYKKFAFQTATALHETAVDAVFTTRWGGDVCFVAAQGTGSRKVELHCLAAVTKYQSFSVQVATAQGNVDKSVLWAMAAGGDLIFLLTQNTGTRVSEAHAMAASTWWQGFSVQTPTAMPLGGL